MDVYFRAPLVLLFIGLFTRFYLIPRPPAATSNSNNKSELTIKSESTCLSGFEAFASSYRNQRRSTMFVRSKSYLLLNLLLLCGDIDTNPGPNWKYPCSSCKKPRCLGMNNDEYQLLANSSCSWICPDCDLPSFFSPMLLDLSSDTLNLSNSFDILSGSVVDNGNNFPRSNPATISSKRNTKTKLKGMIINCNGLKSSKHSTEFQALLDLHDPDIVLGTESKLNPDISSYSIFPPSYSVVRRGRNAFGGGFFQAIKSDLASIEEPNFNVDGCEALWPSLKIANMKTLYISSFYRPPNSSTEILDHLDDSLNNVFLRVPNHPNIIMGGDFNLGDIDWNQEIPSTTHPATASQHNKFMQSSN